VIASVDGYSHPTSTVPMGSVDDPGAVVDANGAVRGIDRLHVVDASIMPDIVSAPTNLTTIMIAEASAQGSDVFVVGRRCCWCGFLHVHQQPVVQELGRKVRFGILVGTRSR
jgi:hypothetical protein